jgi:hypothetical protein
VSLQPDDGYVTQVWNVSDYTLKKYSLCAGKQRSFVSALLYGTHILQMDCSQFTFMPIYCTYMFTVSKLMNIAETMFNHRSVASKERIHGLHMCSIGTRIIGRGKPNCLEKNFPRATFSTINSTWAIEVWILASGIRCQRPTTSKYDKVVQSK